jgi:hypothetical protein
MLIQTLYVSNQNHLAQSKISWWVTTWCLCPPNHALFHHQGLASCVYGANRLQLSVHPTHPTHVAMIALICSPQSLCFTEMILSAVTNFIHTTMGNSAIKCKAEFLQWVLIAKYQTLNRHLDLSTISSLPPHNSCPCYFGPYPFSVSPFARRKVPSALLLHPSSVSLWSYTPPELPPLPAHFLPIRKERNERVQPLLSPQYSFYLLYRSHLEA